MNLPGSTKALNLMVRWLAAAGSFAGVQRLLRAYLQRTTRPEGCYTWTFADFREDRRCGQVFVAGKLPFMASRRDRVVRRCRFPYRQELWFYRITKRSAQICKTPVIPWPRTITRLRAPSRSRAHSTILNQTATGVAYSRSLMPFLRHELATGSTPTQPIRLARATRRGAHP